MISHAALATKMKPASPDANEPDRIAALKRYDVLDSEPEELFDSITQLAAAICDVPIALITFVDTDRQWFKSKVGLDIRSTPREVAFCSHAIQQPPELLIVPDASQDERFHDNPLVTGDPRIRFYAGAPIVSNDQALGTLCVIDRKPRELTAEQTQALATLSKQVCANLDLRLRTQQLEALNASKNRLFSIISHDLRSPLNSILSISELLTDKDMTFDSEESQELLRHMKRSARTTLQITDNLLKMAQFETGRIQSQAEQLDLSEIMDETALALSGKTSAKEIKLTLDCPDGLTAWADRGMLHSIVQNLLANALKFTPKGGTVAIEARNIGAYQAISVADSGSGIKPSLLEKIFTLDSCYSTEGTDGEKGSGLGLSLCKQFAQAIGGDLSLESEYGKGTIATVTVPAKQTSASAAEDARKATIETQSS